jgi:DNA mismatch repair ATPase MutS
MLIDNTTLRDISIFHTEDEFSLFHRFNFTATSGGSEQLRLIFSNPHKEEREILGTQKIIRLFLSQLENWPARISNGTILMIEKFLEYPLDPIDESPITLNNLFYQWLHPADYSMLKYSLPHVADLVKGLNTIAELISDTELPASIKFPIERIHALLQEGPLKKLLALSVNTNLSVRDRLYYGSALRNNYKEKLLELINIYSKLDAWHSMAIATKKFNLQFPQFTNEETARFEAEGLYHPLLDHPISYDLSLGKDHHFLFLTGANMAGKSTLIKAVGTAVFLAHLGMGVPAKKMSLSIFDGLLTNINVTDNIVKGESYFFNEVQRIKNTIEKVSNGQKWMVLIDELFKGTNVDDAMKCSLAVIKGLLKIKPSLFILSTHLYEIGHELKSDAQVSFRYFETQIENEELKFSYQLREGISTDRIGYLILTKEKLVDLLNRL